jgi:hypothetical protein
MKKLGLRAQFEYILGGIFNKNINSGSKSCYWFAKLALNLGASRPTAT